MQDGFSLGPQPWIVVWINARHGKRVGSGHFGFGSFRVRVKFRVRIVSGPNQIGSGSSRVRVISGLGLIGFGLFRISGQSGSDNFGSQISDNFGFQFYSGWVKLGCALYNNFKFKF